MALTYTLTEILPRKLVGTEWEKEWQIDITEYATNGVPLTPALLGFSRLTDVRVEMEEKAYVPKMTGSLTAPILTVYSQTPSTTTTGVLALDEAGATDVGTFRIHAKGRI